MFRPRFRTLITALLVAGSTFSAWGAPTSVDLSVDSVQPPKGLMVGQTGEVIVRLLNRGESPVNSARIVLYIDGQAAGEAKLARPLAGSAKVELSFPWKPGTAGKHRVVAEAEPTDPDVDLTNNRKEESTTVGEQVQAAEVRVVGLAVDEKEMMRDVPVNATVSVENSGDRAVHRVPLTIFEDDRKVVSKVFYTTLEGHSQKDYLLSWLPKKTGKFRLTAVLGQPDVAPPAKSANTVSQAMVVGEQLGYRVEITKIEVSSPAKVDQEVVTEVVVRNTGDRDATDVKVTMLWEGNRVGSARAEVKAGQESHFQVLWVPRRVGKATLHFQVESQGRSQTANRKQEQTRVVDVVKP